MITKIPEVILQRIIMIISQPIFFIFRYFLNKLNSIIISGSIIFKKGLPHPDYLLKTNIAVGFYLPALQE